MTVIARFVNCGSTAHSPQDDRALLTYLVGSGILCGRRNDCARTTPSGMQVAIDSGEVSVPFTKTGLQQIWSHVTVSNSQTITFDVGGASNRYDALVLEIINSGQCPTDAAQAQNGEGIARFRAVRGSTTSPMTDGAITTALGHSNWIRFDDVDIPASATAFGGGGSDASLEQVISCARLSSEATATLTELIDNLENDEPAWGGDSTGSSSAYAITTSPAKTAYAAGQRFAFIANHTNTGGTTLDVDGLGATSIKKEDGATDLESSDLQSGAIYIVIYDGTNFQLVSPPTPPGLLTTSKVVYLSATSSSELMNPTSATAFDTHSYEISANDLINGVQFAFDLLVYVEHGASNTFTLGVGLDASEDVARAFTAASGNKYYRLKGKMIGTAAAGGSVAVYILIEGQGAGQTHSLSRVSVNKATNGALTITFFATFGSSSGGNGAWAEYCEITKKSSSQFS